MKQKLLPFLAISAVLFLSSTLTAQSQYTTVEDSDPEAIAILDKISADFTAHPTHKIEYTLDIELPGEAMESQPGSLIQSGDKFVLEMDSRKIISDAETVWLYLPEINEVQVNDADFDQMEEINSPSDLFKLHKSGKFIFAISSRAVVKGQDITEIEAKPIDPDSDYSKMRLSIKDKGLEVLHLKIFSKDGSRFTMNINKHDKNYKASADTFTFDAAQYDGVHVEDLRF